MRSVSDSLRLVLVAGILGCGSVSGGSSAFASMTEEPVWIPSGTFAEACATDLSGDLHLEDFLKGNERVQKKIDRAIFFLKDMGYVILRAERVHTKERHVSAQVIWNYVLRDLDKTFPDLHVGPVVDLGGSVHAEIRVLK